MGAICLQAAILALFLPETKGAPTLETMDDMNKNPADALLVNGNGREADINKQDSRV